MRDDVLRRRLALTRVIRCFVSSGEDQYTTVGEAKRDPERLLIAWCSDGKTLETIGGVRGEIRPRPGGCGVAPVGRARAAGGSGDGRRGGSGDSGDGRDIQALTSQLADCDVVDHPLRSRPRSVGPGRLRSGVGVPGMRIRAWLTRPGRRFHFSSELYDDFSLAPLRRAS